MLFGAQADDKIFAGKNDFKELGNLTSQTFESKRHEFNKLLFNGLELELFITTALLFISEHSQRKSRLFLQISFFRPYFKRSRDFLDCIRQC